MREKLIARRCRGDRGAVLVIVSVFMIVAVIMTAAVVDLGGLRQEKKEVTLSTDAAALAGASLADMEDPELIASGSTPVDCTLVATDSLAPNNDDFATVQSAVDDYLDRNGGSSGLDCQVVRTGARRGYVLVSADEIVEFAFGPAIGTASGSVAGVSVAAIQEHAGGGGLRPLAVCADGSTLGGTATDVRRLIEEAEDAPDGVLNSGLGRDLTFAIDKANEEEGCGVATGNFGQLDMNGGSNPNSCNNPDGFCWQMENGYDGPVTNPVRGDTGNNFVPSSDAIEGLIANGIRFYVPVYNTAAGSGGTAEFNITHYLEASFIDYCLQKNDCGIDNADGDPMRWFRWQVFRIVNFATVGAPSATPPRICAVSNESGVIAANCEGTALPGGVTPPPPPTPACDFTIAAITGSVTLSGGNPKTTQQEAVFDFEFEDLSECEALAYRIRGFQGPTEIVRPMTADPPSGDTVRIRLPVGTELPSQGTYAVQVLEDSSPLLPEGTLTVSNN